MPIVDYTYWFKSWWGTIQCECHPYDALRSFHQSIFPAVTFWWQYQQQTRPCTHAQKHNHYGGEWATTKLTQIARFIGPTSWGPSGADKTQVGSMLVPWFLLSGESLSRSFAHSPTHWLTHSVILQYIASRGQNYPHMKKWYATRNFMVVVLVLLRILR